MSCAEERKPPSSEYLLLEDQPASTMPYTPSEPMARRNSTPTPRSGATSMPPSGTPNTVTSLPAPNGITMNVSRATDTEIIGASRYSPRLTLAGVRSSLKRSLTASTIGWKSPSGPTRLGPRRSWMNAAPRRSTHSMTATRVRTVPAMTATFAALTAISAHMLALPERLVLLQATERLPGEARERLVFAGHEGEDVGRRGEIEGGDPKLAGQRGEREPERPRLPRWSPRHGDRRARGRHGAGRGAVHRTGRGERLGEALHGAGGRGERSLIAGERRRRQEPGGGVCGGRGPPLALAVAHLARLAGRHRDRDLALEGAPGEPRKMRNGKGEWLH